MNPCAPPVYATYNRSCGHVAGTTAVRRMARHFVSAMADKGQFGWRIRVATDDDLAAVVRGDRCDECTQDGQVQP